MISGRKNSKNFKKKASKKSKSSKKSTISRSGSKSAGLRRISSGKLKVLPPVDNSNIHLSDYGYSLSKSKTSRKGSLKRASKKEGTLPVLRRLNLIRNYTAVKSNKTKMTEDVDYLKKEYAKEKKSKKLKK
jgi:hypothetical protein